jgi:phosphoribosylamine--glycine ligase
MVVVEEYLDGPEVSVFVVTDGTAAVPMLPAQDFKRVGDGDTGPNTGGMGAYAPLDWAPSTLVDEVMSTVALPTLAAMRDRGTPFAGVLYVGLALTKAGPRVVEFNARFGDPDPGWKLPARDPVGRGCTRPRPGPERAPAACERAGSAVGVVVALGLSRSGFRSAI